MHCRTCGYALWNLTTPRCPECGAAFDLRQYRYQPDTVAFACPHCGQLHGGTGPNYIPAQTDTALCQACGKEMRVAEMRVVPLVANVEAVSADRIPWTMRQSLGYWTAWWQTCKLALFDSQRLGEMIDPSCTFGEAYHFAAITGFLGALVNALICVSVLGAMFVLVNSMGSVQYGGGRFAASELVAQMAMQFIGVVGAFIFPLIVYFIYGGLGHLIVRGAPNHRSGFRVTGMSLLYGHGSLVFNIIPFCGVYIGWVWALIASILVLMKAQGISGGRATFAVLFTPLLLLLVCCGSYIVIVALVVAIRH